MKKRKLVKVIGLICGLTHGSIAIASGGRLGRRVHERHALPHRPVVRMAGRALTSLVGIGAGGRVHPDDADLGHGSVGSLGAWDVDVDDRHARAALTIDPVELRDLLDGLFDWVGDESVFLVLSSSNASDSDLVV